MCVSWARVKEGDRVLDLCCGSGDVAFLLSQKVGLNGEGGSFMGNQRSSNQYIRGCLTCVSRGLVSQRWRHVLVPGLLAAHEKEARGDHVQDCEGIGFSLHVGQTHFATWRGNSNTLCDSHYQPCREIFIIFPSSFVISSSIYGEASMASSRGGLLLSLSSFSATSRRGDELRCSSLSSSQRQMLFNNIAPVYDSLNDVLSLGQHHVWKSMCVSWARVKAGDRVLDLCCGSGDVAFLLSQKVGLNGEVRALDFSREQLLIGCTRQDLLWKACYKNIKWVEGDALDLPFSDSCFDAITMGYGIRNVVDKNKVMMEIYRVLKQGSRVSILDFNKSTSLITTMFQDWMIENVVVPVASIYGLSEEYQYLKTSIRDFLTGRELEKLARDVGFSSAKHYEIGGGLMGNLVAIR